MFFLTLLSILFFRCLVSLAVERSVLVHKTYGSVKVNWREFSSLSDVAAMELMNILIMFVTGSELRMKFREWQIFKKGLRSFTTAKTLRSAIVYLEKDRRTFVVGRAPFSRSSALGRTPIHVGETFFWDNRFLVRLERLPGAGEVPDTKFYIRSMVTSDWPLAGKGVRKIKANIMVPLHLRNSLPLIVDEANNVAVAPFLKMTDRRYGVTCSCEFRPKASLEEVVALSSFTVDEDQQ